MAKQSLTNIVCQLVSFLGSDSQTFSFCKACIFEHFPQGCELDLGQKLSVLFATSQEIQPETMQTYSDACSLSLSIYSVYTSYIYILSIVISEKRCIRFSSPTKTNNRESTCKACCSSGGQAAKHGLDTSEKNTLTGLGDDDLQMLKGLIQSNCHFHPSVNK